LHGSATVSPYDGWAENTHITNECKDYFYPNNAARAMWYHDHAIGKQCYYLLFSKSTPASAACCFCVEHQCACTVKQ
jgi:hypothetical protein